MPGDNGDQARQLGATAQLRFRPVIKGPEPAAAAASGSATPSSTGSAAPTSSAPASGSAAATSSAAPNPGAATGSAPATTAAAPSDGAVADPAIPDPNAPPVTQEQAAATYATLTCDKENVTGEVTRSKDYVATCSEDGAAKYLLGPTIIEGTEIADASAGTDQTTGAWIVLLDFKSKGRTTWANYTASHVQQNVAFTLDGRVISAPTIQGAINGRTTITGDFTQEEATQLANQLKYGALPLTFTQATAQSISTELGAEQLKAGLIAGAIGIALVFVYALLYYRLLGLVMIASLILSAVVVYACLVLLYSFLYYRALGFITVASLAISGLLIYACVCLLGKAIGFTLTLAGVAGLIVAVGVTADSFVVFYERIKDEVREGRTVRTGVDRAWVRARRTIISADTVSLLAAVALYLLSIGSVRGFAFTLGLSTLLDLVVVFLFTHPLVAILMRKPFFSTGRFSGLEAPGGGDGPGSSGKDGAAPPTRTRLNKRTPVGTAKADRGQV